MSLPIRLRRLAQVDYDEAVDFYESREAGLGGRFAEALDIVLQQISVQPNRYPETEPGIREADLRHWPFSIVYEMLEDHVSVIAVFHSARDPSVWRKRT